MLLMQRPSLGAADAHDAGLRVWRAADAPDAAGLAGGAAADAHDAGLRVGGSAADFAAFAWGNGC